MTLSLTHSARCACNLTRGKEEQKVVTIKYKINIYFTTIIMTPFFNLADTLDTWTISCSVDFSHVANEWRILWCSFIRINKFILRERKRHLVRVFHCYAMLVMMRDDDTLPNRSTGMPIYLLVILVAYMQWHLTHKIILFILTIYYTRQ